MLFFVAAAMTRQAMKDRKQYYENVPERQEEDSQDSETCDEILDDDAQQQGSNASDPKEKTGRSLP